MSNGIVDEAGYLPGITTALTEDASPAAMRVLQRVVLPNDKDLDTLPLYIDSDTGKGGLDADSRRNRAPVAAAAGRQLHPEDILGRSSVRVRPGERLSFGSYFNAFPASYWRRWTTVDSVILRVDTVGEGTVVVYKSNARGAAQRVESRQVTGSESSVFDLTLAPFGDGGWYWFDLISDSDGMQLESADWSAVSDKPAGSVTLGVTTFNRPDYCLNTIKAIQSDDGVLEILDELIIVDQGNQKVADEAGFDDVAKAMGSQLRIIIQGNLGGSGGFARNMSEAVKEGRSDYVMLLDDDIVVETEGILRAVAFADMCRKPTIVGGHMFDMYNKSVLNAYAEVVNQYKFRWGPVDGLANHDFALEGLRSSSILHRRWDADYNGWWMCLIPTRIIREIGLSLPVFIKWDDAEYSLRARSVGYATVSLPGAAVWHVSWADKDDSVDWQAYFHERNRLIATLLHSPYAKGGRILRESMNTDVKHLFSMQYYPQKARLMALRDVLQGPEKLHESLPAMMPKLRALRSEYTDSVVKQDPGAFPDPHMRKPPKKPISTKSPSLASLVPWAAKTILKQTVLPVAPESRENPQLVVANQDSKWWVLSKLDSAVVSNADGTGASWYQRDPKKVRSMLAEAAVLKAQLFAEWEQLSARYREALPDITSMESWQRTFDENPGK